MLLGSVLLRFTRPEPVLRCGGLSSDGEADEYDRADDHSDGKGDQ
jgi:hypothetical protein